ncbi:hypothetical protein N9924_00960 [bacterium]|nr:hypothetical protein [bacterium]
MNGNGKYLKVWKKKEQNGYVKLDLGDSKKNKDGTYTNWTWFDCLVVGKASNVMVNENDTIEIISSQISQEKFNDKWYTKVVIFEMSNMSSEKPQEQKPETNEFNSFKPTEEDPNDPCPF